jgi:hypothetical protein
MRKRNQYLAITLVIAALGFNIYSNLHTANRVDTTVNESAQTRVTTVRQRCHLTSEVANFSLHAEQVLAHFAPREVPSFSNDYAGFEASYHSCKKQLITVESIANKAPPS